MNIKRKILGGGLSIALAATALLASAPLTASAAATPSVTRIGGADRFEASANISKSAYPNGASKVYIATGANFPDALSIAPVASKNKAPLLLTTMDAVPDSVLNEIVRLKPAEIYVVGGANTISDSVVDRLNKVAPTTRIAGADRYQASAQVMINNYPPNSTSTLYVATGRNFPDALSAAAAAGKRGAPVLLVPGNDATGIDDVVAQMIKYVHPSRVIIAGGENSVNKAAENELRSISGVTSVIRLGGADRFDSSYNIGQEAFPGTVAQAYVATGFNFPDALAGAAVAGAKGAPLYLSTTDCVPAKIANVLKTKVSQQVVLLGGTNSLTANVAALKSC